MKRRDFIKHLSLGALAGTSTLGAVFPASAQSLANNDLSQRNAIGEALRDEADERSFKKASLNHKNNGDEDSFGPAMTFSKALPHDSLGIVEPDAYNKLISALSSGVFSKLGSVNVGIARLANPEAAYTYSLQGSDSRQLKLKPAPSISSDEYGAEMIELYWQALCRDVPFTDYDSSSQIADAASEIGSASGFQGPLSDGGSLSDSEIFRGSLDGDLLGPYLSQFLAKAIPMGALQLDQKIRTVPAGYDQLSDFSDWLAIQNGQVFKFDPGYDPQARYIRNGRDLAEYVHLDQIYQAYFNAAAILLDIDPIPWDLGNPFYKQIYSDGFTTFGRAHVLNLLGEVSNLALRAAWFQKWLVHRRLRPEEMGGRIHVHKTGQSAFDINQQIFDSQALNDSFDKFGTYLLAQGYDEGCPTHPAYPAGHAVVAGACVTLLKAFFNEDFPIQDPVVASSDGLSLDPYLGPDASNLTVGGELNKLASNICLGRNWAGLHYRSDADWGIRLGERVTLKLLREKRFLFDQDYSFSLTRFNGKTVTIGN